VVSSGCGDFQGQPSERLAPDIQQIGSHRVLFGTRPPWHGGPLILTAKYGYQAAQVRSTPNRRRADKGSLGRARCRHDHQSLRHSVDKGQDARHSANAAVQSEFAEEGKPDYSVGRQLSVCRQ
jgi:hypothetical protein